MSAVVFFNPRHQASAILFFFFFFFEAGVRVGPLHVLALRPRIRVRRAGNARSSGPDIPLSLYATSRNRSRSTSSSYTHFSKSEEGGGFRRGGGGVPEVWGTQSTELPCGPADFPGLDSPWPHSSKSHVEPSPVRTPRRIPRARLGARPPPPVGLRSDAANGFTRSPLTIPNASRSPPNYETVAYLPSCPDTRSGGGRGGGAHGGGGSRPPRRGGQWGVPAPHRRWSADDQMPEPLFAPSPTRAGLPRFVVTINRPEVMNALHSAAPTGSSMRKYRGGAEFAAPAETRSCPPGGSGSSRGAGDKKKKRAFFGRRRRDLKVQARAAAGTHNRPPRPGFAGPDFSALNFRPLTQHGKSR